jgi:hypothetical protein
LPLYAPPVWADVRTQVLEWAAAEPTASQQDRLTSLAELWKAAGTDGTAAANSSTGEPANGNTAKGVIAAAPLRQAVGERLHELVIRSLMTMRPEVFAHLNELESRLGSGSSLDGFLDSDQLTAVVGSSPLMRQNLQFWVARRLIEAAWYEEAESLLAQVSPTVAVDPAGYFYCRAVAGQALLNLPLAQAAVDALLHRTESVPVRYRATATLLETELQGIEEKSLGETARLMSDAERRLELGRAGEKLQTVQERIIANLDELIKKLEAQNQGGGGGGSGGGEGGSQNQGGSPAGDSSVKGATAPGETDPKKFSKDGRWGDLPEKEQAEAKNLINRQFPGHYSQAIEQYFRKLATRPAGSGSTNGPGRRGSGPDRGAPPGE